MFLFRKLKPVKKRGPMPSNEVKAALEKFLSEDNTKLVRFLVRYWKDEQTVLTYKELRQAIIDKTVPLQMFRDWQQDYSKMVHEKLVPEWKKAMKTGADNQMKHKNLDIGFKFDPEHWAVKEWLQNHAAELVTASTTEQKKALGALIDMGIQSHMSTDELARYIRSCIELTKSQAVANKRYYDNLKAQLRKDHPRMSDESIKKKAHEAAIKYADKQMQQRAKTIALTEKAKAYEYGRFQHTQQLVEAGILPPQKKVWYTTRNENVCSHCRALHGKSVAMDEYFLDDASNPVFLPPLHPRCKCCIMYEDDKMSRLEEKAIIDYVGPRDSYILNDKLRKHLKLSDSEEEMKNNLDSALRHFPQYKGNLKRTVWFDNEDQIKAFVDSIKLGKNKIFPEYLSTSFMEGYNDEAPIVIYIRNSKKGRNLLEYGENEGEVLYERGSEFQVVNKVFHDGQWFIMLEEVD